MQLVCSVLASHHCGWRWGQKTRRFWTYITLRMDAFPGMIAWHVQGPQGRRSFEHCASVERFDHVARCVFVCFVRVCCLAFCFDHTLYCLFSPAPFYFPSWPATPDFLAFLLGVICFILLVFFVSSSVFVVSCSSLSASMVRFIRSTFPFITNNGTRCGCCCLTGSGTMIHQYGCVVTLAVRLFVRGDKPTAQKTNNPSLAPALPPEFIGHDGVHWGGANFSTNQHPRDKLWNR